MSEDQKEMASVLVLKDRINDIREILKGNLDQELRLKGRLLNIEINTTALLFEQKEIEQAIEVLNKSYRNL